MFTGIVEEVGKVARIEKSGVTGRLSIMANTVLEGTKIGDSIAVNGVCLTVTGIHGDNFTADVMGETFRRSSLGSLNVGSGVNLERAMPADGRFGGHIVSGHIDGMGEIVSIETGRNGSLVYLVCTNRNFISNCRKRFHCNRWYQPYSGKDYRKRLCSIHYSSYRRKYHIIPEKAGG